MLVYDANMHQKVLVESLGAQLDLAQSIVNWAILFAAAVAWAGLQKTREIEAFHVKVDRRDAFVVVAVLYLIATMTVSILFFRIGNLVGLLDKEHFSEGVSVILAHEWILNPLSYFGTSTVGRLTSGEGLGLLVVVWWLCNASLYTLTDEKNSRRGRVLLAIFLAVGTLAIGAIYRVHFTMRVQAVQFGDKIGNALQDTFSDRVLSFFVGSIAGVALFTAVNLLHDSGRLARIASRRQGDTSIPGA